MTLAYPDCSVLQYYHPSMAYFTTSAKLPAAPLYNATMASNTSINSSSGRSSLQSDHEVDIYAELLLHGPFNHVPGLFRSATFGLSQRVGLIRLWGPRARLFATQLVSAQEQLPEGCLAVVVGPHPQP